MEVSLIRWPAEEADRADLARRRRPRLLLVESDAEPPCCSDVLEDWIRLPASPRDTHARLRTLEARTEEVEPPVPALEATDTIAHRSARIQLTPVQARLIRPLLDRYGAVVNRETLTRRAWPAGGASNNTLDVNMVRLRRRLQELGLHIRTVRSRGYLLSDTAR